MGIKQQLWGPALWKAMHYVALNYPQHPSEKQWEDYRRFYMSLKDVLPCPKCAEHYCNNLEQLPLDQYLDSRELPFEWTVRLHNLVNQQFGKTCSFSFEHTLRMYPNDYPMCVQSQRSWKVVATGVVLLTAVVLVFLWFIDSQSVQGGSSDIVVGLDSAGERGKRWGDAAVSPAARS